MCLCPKRDRLRGQRFVEFVDIYVLGKMSRGAELLDSCACPCRAEIIYYLVYIWSASNVDEFHKPLSIFL